MEEVCNLFPDKETNFTNLDNLEAVSRNEQVTLNRDGFEAGSTRNKQATLSRDGFEARFLQKQANIVKRSQSTTEKKVFENKILCSIS